MTEEGTLMEELHEIVDMPGCRENISVHEEQIITFCTLYTILPHMEKATKLLDTLDIFVVRLW